ncbi:3-phosphoshikimate 1-carboxyvinyltransferase [Thalassobacillus devorans]|uniref:3-phosphoshikimate 1-carboxyvinyltransferase n=1 Tax=Thalassobacillus devorans TaxID=279813 RepID=A0ABQ1NZK3_9BACI|nr:3-phosphoshikimate 1-carboxyvinyltransferase [Thalassobacillus devorans]NIK28300.1 3-phosphoshikimate 1-carboxyvinyltransferase [Thalassobacillus devorans]GGC87351.1 3-phosphoshikimate 1-carboxyvinyltransferase [Thalassobacillus devorans]
MSKITLKPIEHAIDGKLSVPGDKSISHRAVIFSSLAEGTSHISNFLSGEDCMRTIQVFRDLGVDIEQSGSNLTIRSNGLESLKEAERPVYFGNSGTTARLVTGLLSGLPLFTTCYGDPSLSKRPMDRVVGPLKKMGANIEGRSNGRLLPLAIKGNNLQGITYEMPVKSAQVKSALLLAGMVAAGETTIIEQVRTRDHTEQMLPQFGGEISIQDKEITIRGSQQLQPADLAVPGDISSAAFFLVAAAIIPGSSILVEDVGINPTRTGLIKALEMMGADITVKETRKIGGEAVGNVEIKYQELTGAVIEGEMIPSLIDELPILALAATQASGVTKIKDAGELRVKETDRIAAVAQVLSSFGAEVTEEEDGLTIYGKASLKAAEVDSYMDHRIGMMIAVASLIAEGETVLSNGQCIDISYPGFFKDLDSLKK